MWLRLCYFVFLSFLMASCSTNDEFEQKMRSMENETPFVHHLDVRYSIGTNKTILLCSHGFGGNSSQIIEQVRPNTSDTLIAFNYIDHDFSHATGDDTKTVMATPIEIMPLIYMLKKCVVDNNISPISLYGFSLGASNVIYAINELLNGGHEDLLKKYNVTASDRASIMQALRKGKILLDSPFKSIEENIALRGPNEILLMYKERAAKHNILSPLETLVKLKDLNLTIFLFFDTNEEEFSNRDDSKFAKNLLDANAKGTNIVISTDNGGHVGTHSALWKIYSALQSK